MTRPEDALERARAEAARKRAAGTYGEPGPAALDESIVSGRPSAELLSRWAVVEGDPRLLYSTRRAGSPVTALKRGLIRLLRQYLGDVESRQTRFNIALLASVQDLQRRVERLEEGVQAARGDHAPGAGDDCPPGTAE